MRQISLHSETPVLVSSAAPHASNHSDAGGAFALEDSFDLSWLDAVPTTSDPEALHRLLTYSSVLPSAPYTHAPWPDNNTGSMDHLSSPFLPQPTM